MESPKAGYIRDQNEEESGVGKREVALSGGRGDDSREERQDAEGRDDPKGSSSSLMLGLLEEFTQIYSDRLQRVEQAAMKCDEKQYLQNKVCILESWVRDLGEQNAVLVTTVEELEREAAERVSLLEDRLAKMATTTRESCVSLRDHQIQMSSLVTDKIGLENEAKGLSEKMLTIERKNICLKEENSNLQSDLNNLVQVITRARQTGQWETDDLTFSCVTPEQVFGPVLSSSRRSSQSLKESQRDYFRQVLEGQFKKDNSSIASSFSNLQDADSSVYGGRGSEKDLIIMKLKADLRNLQTTHEETSQQLLERDKQIADLQSQLMEVHHELAVSQAEVTNISHTLQEVRHRNRHENVEVTRKEEVIRHLLSKQSSFKKDSVKGSSPSLCELDTVITGENNVEAQLSENIDVLASRLAELEEECQQLQNEHRALQDIHALCTPTINMLQEQLNRSHQTQVELRTVLTAEVAQRHDQLVNLRDELKDQEQKHHETRMQLQLKTHVIKDLRKEVRDLKERQLATDDKNALTPLKDGLCNGMKGTISAETQTCEIFANKTGSSAEETTQTSSSGFYSPASQTPHISKLENELAEKNILLRELQSHLAASRQELHLKDETLYKLEQKLESSRRDGGQKGERMQYLTGQLTSLQLEVGRTHGQAEQLRRQVEKKTELVEKLETENSSLTQQLNEKSATLERFQTEILKISSELEKKKKEVTEQRMTIRTLQEALVASKRSCDDLRSRLDNDVSAGMLHHSLPPQIYDSSNNPPASNPSVTKSIPLDSSSPQSSSELPSACLDCTSAPVNSFYPTLSVSANCYMPEMPLISDSISHSRTQQHSSLQPVERYNSDTTTESMVPDVRPTYQFAKEIVGQNTSCAITPDVLSSCSGSSFLLNSSSCPSNQDSNSIPNDPPNIVSERDTLGIGIVTDGLQNQVHTGQVYDV